MTRATIGAAGYLDRHAVHPLTIYAQVEAVEPDEPVGGWHDARGQRHLSVVNETMRGNGHEGTAGGSRYPRVVAVDEELGLGAALAGSDGRSVELVEYAALALRLGVEGIASAGLGELLEAVARLVADAEQRVIGVVRATWRQRKENMSSRARLVSFVFVPGD